MCRKGDCEGIKKQSFFGADCDRRHSAAKPRNGEVVAERRRLLTCWAKSDRIESTSVPALGRGVIC